MLIPVYEKASKERLLKAYVPRFLSGADHNSSTDGSRHHQRTAALTSSWDCWIVKAQSTDDGGEL